MAPRFLAIAVLFAATMAAMPATAGEPLPIRDFIHHPEYSGAKISPDGRFLALTMQQEAQKVLTVLTLQDMKVIRITRLTGGESVGDFYWVGSDRLMYTSTKNFGSLAAPFGTGAWYAMDADGGHPRTLVSYSSDANTGRNRMVHFGEVYRMLDPDPAAEGSATVPMLPRYS